MVIKLKTKFKFIMVGVIVLNVIINAILFSNIFWILTIIGKFFYSNKYQNLKFNFYECGFKNLTKFKTSYSINFLLLILFLLLYDGEFLIIIPFSLNIFNVNFINILVILYFLMWLQLTILLDYVFNALDWQV